MEHHSGENRRPHAPRVSNASRPAQRRESLDDTRKDPVPAPGQKVSRSAASVLTVFDGPGEPTVFDLNQARKESITFGRKAQGSRAEILFDSGMVSRNHGRFVRQNGIWYIQDTQSTNGIICNGKKVQNRLLKDGDILYIGMNQGRMDQGVLMLATRAGRKPGWDHMPMEGSRLTIGRDPECDICIPSVNCSKHHAQITRQPDGSLVLSDNHSTNGVFVNNQWVRGRRRLQEKDIITVAGNRLILSGGSLYYSIPVRVSRRVGSEQKDESAPKYRRGFIPQRKGISVEAEDVVVRRGKGTRSFITSDHVSLRVEPGELVSIIGGSGAGKSTILNAMSGYLKPYSGHVYINGIDLYQHFDEVKKLIGYVPQQDIVFDTLSLYDTLMYTAKLRLPEDTTPAEREAAIDRAISMVELQEKKNAMIKNLSGG